MLPNQSVYGFLESSLVDFFFKPEYRYIQNTGQHGWPLAGCRSHAGGGRGSGTGIGGQGRAFSRPAAGGRYRG